MRSITRDVALSPADWWGVLCALVSLTLVDVALRTVGFQRLVRYAGAGFVRRAVADTPQAHRRAHRYARWIEIAARHHLVAARCLHRSLALHHWLRCEGLPSELRIGVRKDGYQLKAHAWIELSGCVVNDRRAAIAGFTPLVSREDGFDASNAAASVVGAWE